MGDLKEYTYPKAVTRSALDAAKGLYELVPEITLAREALYNKLKDLMKIYSTALGPCEKTGAPMSGFW